MPRPKRWPPPISFHRASGKDRVRINDRDYYLGPHDSQEAREAYLRLIAEHGGSKAPNPSTPAENGHALTVAELIARFLDHMEARYRGRVGGHTSEFHECRYALQAALDLYGSLPCGSFGPKSLKAVRQVMLDAGLSLGVVNQRVARIKRAFKWATEEELLPAHVWHGLQAVRRLPQPAARPKPVAADMIEAVRRCVRPTVADMIQVQRLTGQRPGELVIMRPCDIDRSGDVWVYRPSRHKTQWKGIDRLVLIGPQAQAILARYLDRPPEAFLFSPAEAMAGLRAGQQARRKGKKRNWRKSRPRRRPGERYQVGSYNHAVQRGCDRAFPHPALAEIAALPLQARAKARRRRAWVEAHGPDLAAWRRAHRFHVHQLRHTAGTLFRAAGGLDAAQKLLGHERRETTEGYAGVPPEVIEVARRVG